MRIYIPYSIFSFHQGGGSKSALADPYAKPNELVVPDMDACLKHVAHALLKGPHAAAESVVMIY